MVIIGCGRAGAKLAMNLVVKGHSVAVIDKDPAAFARLSQEGPTRLVGVGSDRGVLLRADIERADAFAAMTGADSSNILSARIARRVFSVPKVATYIADPLQTAVYCRLGIPTISPTTWGALTIMEIALSSEFTPRYSFGSGEVELVEVEVPHHLAWYSVAQFTVVGQIVVAALVRQGRAVVPVRGTQLEAGDLLYLSADAMFKGKLAQMVHH